MTGGMELKKIVITGGPCGGKTSALEVVRRVLTEKGYTVLTVSETATELICGGVAPWTCSSSRVYQTCQLKLQLEKERIYEEAARTMGKKKILILCDRGVLDNKAYLSPEDYQGMLDEVGVSEEALLNRYDGVFHLLSAAKELPEAYTTANNSARTETPEEAAALDDRIALVWGGHSHYFRIEACRDFSGKMRCLAERIQDFLK